MKRMKVCLVEDPLVETEIASEGDFMSDAYRTMVRFKTQFVEIGWAEIEQMQEGRLELKMTLVGSYVVGEGLAPDLAEFRGVIPTTLRQG